MLSITVNTLVDENNGVGMGAGTSLREAIAAAIPGDAIDFSVTGTINLVLGQLLINKSLTIDGPDAAQLTIDATGNDPTPSMNNGDGSRVFYINDGQFSTGSVVSISRLTITGGDVFSDGAGIWSQETLQLNGCVVVDNHAFGNNFFTSHGIVQPFVCKYQIHDRVKAGCGVALGR